MLFRTGGPYFFLGGVFSLRFGLDGSKFGFGQATLAVVPNHRCLTVLTHTMMQEVERAAAVTEDVPAASAVKSPTDERQALNAIED